MTKKIILTGCAGFIGSNLLNNLLDSGFEVLGVDNFDNFYDKSIKLNNIENSLNHPKFKLFEIDLNDNYSIQDIFKNHKIDIIIHLAAKAGVRPSILRPHEYYQTNVIGTLNILELMKKMNIKKMIYASSSSVYGNNKKLPFSENDNVDNPISPYAASKKAGELLCHTYSHLHQFNITCLRFFTVYGPRQRPDLAIYKFTKAILDEKPITLYGDGSSERDYTYIDDIISGIINSMNNMGGYRIYNLGESKTIKLMHLIKSLEKLIKKKAIITRLPNQPGDVERTYADISKASNEIGYSPKYDFEQGLTNFINWFKNRV